MTRKFIDREEELEFLEKEWKKNEFSMIPVYGRRRVGKTELIQKFMQDKPSIRFLADKSGTKNNVLRFRKKVANFFQEAEPVLESFQEIFEYITQKSKEKLVIAIDEFPYLIEKDKSIPSIFQYVVDEILKEENIMLILCGSSIGMMETEVLDYKAPLYGRRAGQIKLRPFTLKEVGRYFSKVGIEKLIEIYSVTSGIPLYLSFFDTRMDFITDICNNFFDKKSLLYAEAEILLKEELRDPSTFENILASMASGATRVSEIANKSFLNARDLPYYLGILENLGIIKKEHPITEKSTTKKTLYTIEDLFFLFWFTFVYPYRDEIDAGNKDYALSILKRGLNTYFGHTFEQVAEEALWEIRPFPFTKIGRWWHKDKEIDLVALNSENKEIGFFEVKWTKLKLKDTRKILKELEKKAEFVEWNNEKRKEYCGIIAKKIYGKKKLREEGFLCYDFRDMKG